MTLLQTHPSFHFLLFYSVRKQRSPQCELAFLHPQLHTLKTTLQRPTLTALQCDCTAVNSHLTHSKIHPIKCPSVKVKQSASCFGTVFSHFTPLHSLKAPGNSPERGKARELFTIRRGKWQRRCGADWGNSHLRHCKNLQWYRHATFLFMCLQSGHGGVTQRASGHGCEAVAPQLEPGSEYHMIGALAMAIMTAAVVGLRKGYDQLRKSHSLLPLEATLLWHRNFFSVSYGEPP